MGAIFRPKYPPPGQSYREAREAGTLRESSIYWVRYQKHGKTIKQSKQRPLRGRAVTS